MTRYRPILDRSGAPIGVLFVGMELTQALRTLHEQIARSNRPDRLRVRAGRPPWQGPGPALVHPTQEGNDLLDSRDAAGRPVIRDMLASGTGIIYYPWLDAALGDSQPHTKVAAYRTYARWGWLICAGSYVDELTTAARQIRDRLLIGAAVLTVAALLLMRLMTQSWVARPLGRVVAQFERLPQATCGPSSAPRGTTPRARNRTLGRGATDRTTGRGDGPDGARAGDADREGAAGVRGAERGGDRAVRDRGLAEPVEQPRRPSRSRAPTPRSGA